MPCRSRSSTRSSILPPWRLIEPWRLGVWMRTRGVSRRTTARFRMAAGVCATGPASGCAIGFTLPSSTFTGGGFEGTNCSDRRLQPRSTSALNTTARIRFLFSFTYDPRRWALRDWVVTLAAPGMAAHDPLESEPAAAGSAIALKCCDGIGRTAGLVTAAGRKHLGRTLLPAACNQDEQPGDHGRTFS